MSNELATIHRPRVDYDELFKLCQRLHAAKIFPQKSPEEMLGIIISGAELGIPESMSLRSFIMVQGNLQAKAVFVAERIVSSGKYEYTILKHTDTECEIEFFKLSKGDRVSVGTSKYTMDDARRAKLDSKDNWKSHPKNMLFARAISNGQKWFCPDVFAGAIYTEGDDFSEPINVTPKAKPAEEHSVQQQHEQYESDRKKIMDLVKSLSKDDQEWLKDHFHKETGRVLTFKDRSLTLGDFSLIDGMIGPLTTPSIPHADFVTQPSATAYLADLEAIWKDMNPEQKEGAFDKYSTSMEFEFSFSQAREGYHTRDEIDIMHAICKDILAQGVKDGE